MGGSQQVKIMDIWTPEMEQECRAHLAGLLHRRFIPALHAFFERFDSNAEFSETELKETENLFIHLSMCVDQSSESPDVVTLTIFNDDLFSMDRIVQLCSSNLSPLVKSFLERFVDPHSSASHPLVVEIVTSGTFKRLLDIFEPLSLPFTPHQSTPSPTDFSFRGKHPVEVHKFIIHLIINILTMWQNPSLSNFNPTFFQPSPHYGAMTVTLKLTQEYLRRVCETSKLVTHVFEESEIFGVLGNILLAAQHVDEAYSLLCELPILQAAMIFFDAFLKPFHVSHFLDDLERLFQPSYSALPARPDRIGIVRRMVMEEGWSDKTEQMLDYMYYFWSQFNQAIIKELFDAFGANLC